MACLPIAQTEPDSIGRKSHPEKEIFHSIHLHAGLQNIARGEPEYTQYFQRREKAQSPYYLRMPLCQRRKGPCIGQDLTAEQSERGNGKSNAAEPQG